MPHDLPTWDIAKRVGLFSREKKDNYFLKMTPMKCSEGLRSESASFSKRFKYFLKLNPFETEF